MKRTKSKNSGAKRNNSLNLELLPIKPLTDNQKKVFDSNNHVVLNGSAGTGKTFITSYLGMRSILDREFSRLIYVRSAVPTRDIGFLPGTEKDKMEVYERPYSDIMADLFGRGDAYDILKLKQLVQFIPTSFLRGTTLRDAVVIVDECQNMSYHELDSIITRIGDNCQLYLCGDYYQSDLKGNGLNKFHKVLKAMDCFDVVEFSVDDIVRSDLVKEYLLAKFEVFGKQSVE